MKKRLLIFIMTAAAALALSACGRVELVYPDCDSYSSGGGEISGAIDSLDIQWLDGEVSIEYCDGGAVSVSETSAKSLTDETSVHWRVDGTTLQIKYAASGYTGFGNLNKKLTVSLPEGLKLSGLYVSSASGEVVSGLIDAGKAEVSTASGDVSVALRSGDIAIDTASGSISLTQEGEAERISLSSASGRITAALDMAERLSIDTASGRIEAEVQSAERAEAESASGRISLTFRSAPEELEIDSASGRAELYLPASAGFTAEISTASGDFDSDLPLIKNGDTYVCGDGSGEIRIDTASGDVFLGALQ